MRAMSHSDSSDFPITQRRLRRWAVGLGVVLILVLGAIVLLAEPTESPSAAVSPDAVISPLSARAQLEYGNDLPLASPRPGKVLVAGSKNEVCGLGNVPVGQSVEDLERGNAPKIA
jgi:hypothetical protein